MSCSVCTSVLGHCGSRGYCRKSFVVRCPCSTCLLCATSASDVLHGLIKPSPLKAFAQSVVSFLSPVKGMVRRHLEGVQSIVRLICCLKAHSVALAMHQRFRDCFQAHCVYFWAFSSLYCDSFVWRSIDTFSYLVRGWTLFGVTYRTM